MVSPRKRENKACQETCPKKEREKGIAMSKKRGGE